MTRKSVQSENTIGDLKPVYLIHGKERFLLEEAIGRLKSSFADEGDLSFNYDQFFGDKDRARAIIEAAQILPFISSKRLILVRDVDKMTPADSRELADYLKKSSDSTCLVLVAEELKKTNPLYKVADQQGQVFEYKLASKREYPKWVSRKFKERGKQVNESAAKLLVESIGYDLQKLANEIEKISLYYAGQVTIAEAEITSIICDSSEKSIFDLVDSIGACDKDNSFCFLDRLLDKNSDPPQIIFFMIVRQFRLLLRTKSLLNRRVSEQAIAKELRVPFFVARKLKEQCGNFSSEKLEEIYRLLAEADLALKTGARTPRLLLEDLLTKIMR